MSSGQRMLEEVQAHLEEAKKKLDLSVYSSLILFFYRHADSEAKSDRAGRLLGQVKTGINHLAEKLQNIKAVRYFKYTILYPSSLLTASCSYFETPFGF